MRRPREYRAFILSGGVTLYAAAMWLAWFDDHRAFMPGPSEAANHEMASVIGMLAGISLILVGTIVQGWTLKNARRALGGAGMIVTAFVMVSLWDRGMNFLYLGPSIHSWSAGFLLIPMLLIASGIAWLLMAIGGAWRAGRTSTASDAVQQ